MSNEIISNNDLKISLDNKEHHVIDIKDSNNNEQKESCFYKMFMSFLSFLIVILSLSLAAGIVAYYVFAIMGLVKDEEYLKDCPNNNVWVYVLVVLILNFIIGKNVNKRDDDGNHIIGNVLFSFALAISMAAWGTAILTSNSCDGIKSSIIWKMTIVNVVLNYFSAILSMILLCMVNVLNDDI